jgi:hypothetical protein
LVLLVEGVRVRAKRVYARKGFRVAKPVPAPTLANEPHLASRPPGRCLTDE